MGGYKHRKRNELRCTVIAKQLVGHSDNSGYPQTAVHIQVAMKHSSECHGPERVIMDFGFTGGFPRPPGAAPRLDLRGTLLDSRTR